MFTQELKADVKWKKRKGDHAGAIPSAMPPLLQRYVETIEHPDLTLSQFLEETGMQGCL
jgi:hypothetical protein